MFERRITLFKEDEKMTDKKIYITPDNENKGRYSRQELVLITKFKAIACMILFAVAIVVCLKVARNLNVQGEATAKSPEAQPEPVYKSTQVTKESTASVTTAKPSNEKEDEAAIASKKKEAEKKQEKTKKHKTEVIDGITYVDGILVANKTYSLPADYDPGLDPKAEAAFNKMAKAAEKDGLYLFICSGYRSYYTQTELYNSYVWSYGVKATDRFSARPGHSEHQSGLAMDINLAADAFDGTPEAKWLAKHCVEYGFIIRYKKDKESVTGFKYEPWHIRYLGVETAKKVEASGLALEEYLGIDSVYKED